MLSLLSGVNSKWVDLPEPKPERRNNVPMLSHPYCVLIFSHTPIIDAHHVPCGRKMEEP